MRHTQNNTQSQTGGWGTNGTGSWTPPARHPHKNREHTPVTSEQIKQIISRLIHNGQHIIKIDGVASCIQDLKFIMFQTSNKKKQLYKLLGKNPK